jgi:hypothetical protein
MIEQSKEDEEANHRQPVSDEPIFNVQEKTVCTPGRFGAI